MNRTETLQNVFSWALRVALGGLLFGGAALGRAASRQDLDLSVHVRDTVAPNAVVDLTAVDAVTPGQAVLTWTAPEDNAGAFTSLEPVSAYIVKYATFSIASEIAAGGDATTWWAQASTAPFAPTNPAPPGTAETPMGVNLSAGVRYWFAVRSLDDVGQLSPLDLRAVSPDQQATVLTRALVDDRGPAPVAGFVVTPTSSGYMVTWSPVTKNDEGAPLLDLTSYQVYRSSRLFGFESSSTTVATISASDPPSVDLPTPSEDAYFLIVAVDSGGQMSSPRQSNYLWVTPNRFIGQIGVAPDGTQSRAFVPEGLIPDLKTSDKNYLLCVEPNTTSLASAGGSRTRATYSVFLRDPDGAQASAQKSFSRPEMTVSLHYTGGNGALDKNKMGVLWWNGTTWIKVGQANVTEGLSPGDLTVSFRTSVQGVYQIRQYEIAKELTLDRASVFPQIFSPNGDGRNDEIYFVIENPRLSSVRGRVLDSGGAEVGVLRPAGPGAPTSDTLVWDGRDSSGHPVRPGVYIYEIKGEGKTMTGTLVVAR